MEIFRICIRKLNEHFFTRVSKSILAKYPIYFFLIVYIIYLMFVSYYYIINSYLNFDEFLHLQEPKNFAEFNLFATYYNGVFRVLDPLISVGPTLLLPIGLMFKIFGTNFLIARIYMGLIFLIFILVYLYIACKFWGRKIMLLLSLFLLSVPHLFDYSLHVLGEIPAMLFFLVGVLFFNKFQSNPLIRYLIIAGVCLALAIITKTIYILLFPALIFLTIYCYMTGRKFVNVVALIAIIIVTIIIDISICIYYLGIYTYRSNLSTLIGAYGQLGGAVGENLLLNKLVLIAPKISILSVESGLNIYTLAIVLLIILAGFILYLHNRYLTVTEFFFFSFALIYAGWWFLISTLPWYRHLFPAILLLVPVVAISINEYSMRLIGYLGHSPIPFAKCILVILGLILIAAAYFVLLYSNFSSIPFSCEYRLEKECIDYINTNIERTAKIGYWGWWQAPEISFFVNNTFINILTSKGQERLRSGIDYVILPPLQTTTDPQAWKYENIYCGDIIFHNEGYVVYKYKSINFSENFFDNYLKTIDKSNFSDRIDFSNENYDNDQIIEGFYNDPVSWRAIGKTASFCLKNCKNATHLTIYGFVPQSYFKHDILINISLNGISKKSVLIDNNTGNFEVVIDLPENISIKDTTCTAIEANQTYTPQNGDPRDISLILTKMFVD